MKLYYSETPNPRKSCAVAKYLGLPVEYVRLDIGRRENRTPEFLAINPNGRLPALVDGETRLWESNAIMCYLAEAADADLWPNDARRIDIIRWFSWDSAHFSVHAGTIWFERFLKGQFGLGGPDAAIVDRSLQRFNVSAAVLDGHLAGRDYLVGDAPTLADFAVAMMLPYAEAAELPLTPYPEIRRWHAGLEALEAWREPFPERAAA